MVGYGKIRQTTQGLLNRLYARAFILQEREKESRVVIVVCDVLAVFQVIHQQVIKELAQRYPGIYTEQNVVLHATHTHSTPGGSSAYAFYSFSTLGFHRDNFDTIVNGILQAIEQAHNSMDEGCVRLSRGKVAKAGRNRSPFAYNANPKEERERYEDNVDSKVRLFQFWNVKASRLRGLLTFFPVHATSLTSNNQLVSGDNHGYAESVLEDNLRDNDTIVAIGNSNSGDVSPNLVDRGDGTLTGEGKDDIESAEIIGGRLAERILWLLDQESDCLNAPLSSKLSYNDFSNIVIGNWTLSNTTTIKQRRTCPAVLGQNFIAGTEDGRGFSMFYEGDLKTNPYLGVLQRVLFQLPEWVAECHLHHKVPFVGTGLATPAPWTPSILPLQIVRIGPMALVVTSFEVTTMAGRRIRDTLLEAFNQSVTDIEIVATSNGYAQYVTTLEEYKVQEYEGASTLFGPHQLEAMQQELVRISLSVVSPEVYPIECGPSPYEFDFSSLVDLESGVIFDSVPWGKQFGDLHRDVYTKYDIGSTVEVSFYGGHPKVRYDEIKSFCDVERLGQSSRESQTQIWLRDDSWDVRMHWSRMGLSFNKVTCSWYIRNGSRTSIPGVYRIKHHGFAKRWKGDFEAYDGNSSTFVVL
uniref:Neutral ceramidase n=1 Tax=Albugo laibachii Nc14 TaxID=890382 RepID=F0WQP2_9STRA|nr:alkaline ceramidase putative [Albugo laibachii Nc14]|eukprot:CCA23651.1 alkaline ceramidase putative [Albugo laibachii Nc14]